MWINACGAVELLIIINYCHRFLIHNVLIIVYFYKTLRLLAFIAFGAVYFIFLFVLLVDFEYSIVVNKN